jgi:hypothetical protein
MGQGALLGMLTLPISQKEMQNRTTSDTILLLITSFVYTYAMSPSGTEGPSTFTSYTQGCLSMAGT